MRFLHRKKIGDGVSREKNRGRRPPSFCCTAPLVSWQSVDDDIFLSATYSTSNSSNITVVTVNNTIVHCRRNADLEPAPVHVFPSVIQLQHLFNIQVKYIRFENEFWNYFEALSLTFAVRLVTSIVFFRDLIASSSHRRHFLPIYADISVIPSQLK